MKDFEGIKDINEVFNKPDIPIGNSKKVGLWQVCPIRKGVRLYSETH